MTLTSHFLALKHISEQRRHLKREPQSHQIWNGAILFRRDPAWDRSAFKGAACDRCTRLHKWNNYRCHVSGPRDTGEAPLSSALSPGSCGSSTSPNHFRLAPREMKLDLRGAFVHSFLSHPEELGRQISRQMPGTFGHFLPSSRHPHLCSFQH